MTQLHLASDKLDDVIKELHELLTCYQRASADDKRIVWAVLAKYMRCENETTKRFWISRKNGGTS